MSSLFTWLFRVPKSVQGTVPRLCIAQYEDFATLDVVLDVAPM